MVEEDWDSYEVNKLDTDELLKYLLETSTEKLLDTQRQD